MRTTKRQKARAGLSLALRNLHAAEERAREHARSLAEIKPLLTHARKLLLMATEDARKAGVL